MRSLPLALVLALLLAPAAAAHTSVFSSDGKYRIVVGQLGEPVVTYAKTGLDLCIQMNTTARPPAPGVNPGALTATLVSPGGERLSQPLTVQFGRSGCFQFQDPYILTEPGQYTVDLQGSINGTAVDLRGVEAGGAVDDLAALTFPATSVPTLEQLALAKAEKAELEALRARVAALEARPAGNQESPLPAALAVAGLLGALALAMRRRAEP
jgi:hypothetical protein